MVPLLIFWMPKYPPYAVVTLPATLSADTPLSPISWVQPFVVAQVANPSTALSVAPALDDAGPIACATMALYPAVVAPDATESISARNAISDPDVIPDATTPVPPAHPTSI